MFAKIRHFIAIIICVCSSCLSAGEVEQIVDFLRERGDDYHDYHDYANVSYANKQ